MNTARARILVPLSVLALVAGLVTAPAQAAPPGPDKPRVSATHQRFARTATLPDPSGEHAQEARGKQVTIAEVDVDADAAVLGVTWPGGSGEAEVLYRTVTDGTPSAWEHAHVESPGTAEDATRGTEAIIVSGVDSVEVATISAQALDAEVSLYSSEQTAGTLAVTGDAAAVTTATAYDSLRPTIRSRAAWGANETIVGLPYEEGIVSGAMIHHTAGTNSYTAAAVPGLLRSIQAYHVNSRGWKDIGYNVLVDRFGTAWEGRGGGLDRAIAGGHAYGVTNYRTFGLSFMGNFDQVSAPAAMISKAQDIIAWKFALHGVNPYGSTHGSGGQDGGSTFLNAISGHRDENATSCPGANVYARLPAIRSAVRARLAGVPYTVVQPQPTPIAVLPSPSPVNGKVIVREDGFLDKGTVIELQKWAGSSPDGTWGPATTTAIQRRVGAPATGVRDAATIARLQQAVGASATGTLDTAAVAALQRYLNRLPAPYSSLSGHVIYAAHSQNRGWMRGVTDGATAGTTGQSLRLEAVRFALGGGLGGDVVARAHVSNVGWMAPTGGAGYAGTVGVGRAVEALQLTLSGAVASSHTIRYRAHVSGIGWQAWVSNGASAGTTGQSRAIEAIQVQLVPRAGAGAPAVATASYQAHSQDIGWGPAVGAGTVGTVGKRMEALRLRVSAPGVSGDISYRAHVQNVGWMPAQNSANAIGTTGRGLRMEAFQINLTGTLASRYHVRYRAHVSGLGWLPWVADGGTAGTVGQGRQVEMVEVSVVAR